MKNLIWRDLNLHLSELSVLPSICYVGVFIWFNIPTSQYLVKIKILKHKKKMIPSHHSIKQDKEKIVGNIEIICVWRQIELGYKRSGIKWKVWEALIKTNNDRVNCNVIREALTDVILSGKYYLFLADIIDTRLSYFRIWYHLHTMHIICVQFFLSSFSLNCPSVSNRVFWWNNRNRNLC